MTSIKQIDLTKINAYYINLKEDKEKAEALENTLKDLGFKNIHRFEGIKEEIKRVGVAKSHNQILKELSNTEEPFIIFEDDVVCNKFEKELSFPEDSDAFYLGNSTFGLYQGVGKKKISAEKYYDNIYRVYNMLAAHAIVYFNNDYVKFLAKATEFNIFVKTNQDKARAETMKYWNIYANSDPMFYQSGAHSPVTKRSLSKLPIVGPESAYG